jgi:arylsulfatase A-like enzyme
LEEGLLRALAFANGRLLPKKVRGTKSEEFIHIADWYTTFCKLAGVDQFDSETGKFPVDGLAVWPIITGENTTTPHEEFILGYEFNGTGAIVTGNYDNRAQYSTFWQFPCIKGTKGPNCDPYCLYDIINDPKSKTVYPNQRTLFWIIC